MPGEPRTARYDVVIDGTPHHLEGIEWADWDAAGRLLVATTDGRLQAREGDPVRPDVAFEAGLGALGRTRRLRRPTLHAGSAETPR